MSAEPAKPASALSEEAIRADERERVAALLTDNAGVFDGYGTAEAMRKALVVMLTLPFGNAPSCACGERTNEGQHAEAVCTVGSAVYLRPEGADA